MITINELSRYKDKILNKNLTAYIDSLVNQYKFNNDIDFTPLVNALTTELDKKIIKPIFLELRNKGTFIEPVVKFDEYNYYDYKMDDNHQRAIQKNRELIYDLGYLRYNALGIGTNKLKRRLNKLAINDVIAKSLRIAIEIEDVNIQAKKSYGKYKSKFYDKKSELINELVNIFQSNSNWSYGIHHANGRETNSIIFFEIPTCEQISFHTNLNSKNYPIYSKEWDKKENSTYDKLLDCIERNYKDVLELS